MIERLEIQEKSNTSRTAFNAVIDSILCAPDRHRGECAESAVLQFIFLTVLQFRAARGLYMPNGYRFNNCYL